MYSVDEKIIDLAGKIIVRVIIDSEKSIFLKFDHEPTQEQIDSEVEKVINFEII